MKLLFTIILFTYAFADTITYEKYSAATGYGKKEFYLKQVEFDGVTNGKVYYTYTLSKSETNDPEILKNIKKSDASNIIFTFSIPVQCYQILSIDDDEGNQIEFNCINQVNRIDQTVPEPSNSNVATRIGGVMIMAGAGMLYYDISIDCLECDLEELQSFAKDSIDRHKVAYVLIGLGGLLIALGG
ncbi:hypothetical protein HOE22_05190 [Candidatus Woesearchaeota archaeon]|jgi:hypothetical protein|nr:hypothetical protein [Candidatus Woesearchaeota archaeon]MBT4852211.1 hypothetical protein [Candidatus Neomarinimicrobiota bacterium]